MKKVFISCPSQVLFYFFKLAALMFASNLSLSSSKHYWNVFNISYGTELLNSKSAITARVRAGWKKLERLWGFMCKRLASETDRENIIGLVHE